MAKRTVSRPVRPVEFHDIQALARFGCGHLKESHFVLLQITNVRIAGEWLMDLDVQSAESGTDKPDAITQIAFTESGLRCLGLPETLIEQFSAEFIQGMAHDENRSRRLGDIGHNAPEHWQWGASNCQQMHVLLMLYTRAAGMSDYKHRILDERFRQAFDQLLVLPTTELLATEPFGFVDGISQPEIDWAQNQSTDTHARDRYSNLLAPGEIVLGYNNEYGQITQRPLISLADQNHACNLPITPEDPGQLDFGGNGTYLVIRQLEQHVNRFWQFMHDQSDADTQAAEKLAAAMVGRHKDGTALIKSDGLNDFTYDSDPHGLQCPVSSHIRRSNPRSGDFPPGITSWFDRLIKALGFKTRYNYEDLIASTRFHRILRRGRTYGNAPDSSPSKSGGSKPATHESPQGLQFICLTGNILRQFEFVQSAWSVSSAFAGLRDQRDPLLGHRFPGITGTPSDAFLQATEHGVQKKTCALPDFITVRGGGYFFMPGIRAIRYLAQHAKRQESPQ